MFAKIARLFVIKTKFEAFMVIYGLGLGAVERGVHYVQQYPGFGGWMLFSALRRGSRSGAGFGIACYTRSLLLQA